MNTVNRKNFILNSVSGAAGYILLPRIFNPPQNSLQHTPVADTELVKQFDGANAVNNLGGWDWEDAIGAAGHVGIPELATWLLDKGARPTICVAAMLGKIDVVKAYITAFPHMKDAVGPHKISLVRHAKAGGESAKEVLEYLQSIGAKE